MLTISDVCIIKCLLVKRIRTVVTKRKNYAEELS